MNSFSIWYQNSGTASFTAKTFMPGTSSRVFNGESTSAADINGDGYLDYIFTINSTYSDIYIKTSVSGTFTYSVGSSFGLSNIGTHEESDLAWGDCNDGNDFFCN